MSLQTSPEIDENIDLLTSDIIGAAIEVQRHLGPGLLESMYEVCLLDELTERKFKVEHQKELPLIYKNKKLDMGYRIDLLIEGKVIIEVKSVSTLLAIHEAQLLSYLKLSNLNTGLLINFNVKLLKDGIRRIKL